MSWNAKWYGQNNSLIHKFVVNGLVVGSLASFYGLWIDFLVSEFWWRWGFYVSMFMAVTSTAAIVWGFATGRLKSQPGITPRKRTLGLLTVPFILLGMYWMIVVRVVPDAMTRMVGVAASVVIPLTAEHSSSRRRCDYRLDGPALRRAAPADLCISSTAVASFPMDVTATLSGRKTLFGLHIDSVADIKSADNASKADAGNATQL